MSKSPLRPLPAHLLPCVLLVQPLLQGGEVFEDGPGVNLAFAGQRLQRVGPGFALAHGKHLVELRAGFFRAVKRAAVEWTLVAGLATERAVELELQYVRQE